MAGDLSSEILEKGNVVAESTQSNEHSQKETKKQLKNILRKSLIVKRMIDQQRQKKQKK